MAVNENVIGASVSVNEKALSRARERKFYLFTGFLFALVVFVGFSKAYYLRLLFDLPPLYSNLVRFHGIVMSAWVLLFVTQAWLVSARRVRLHMKLGWAGVAMALLVLATGYLVSVGAVAHQTPADRGGIHPLVFLVVPIVDLILFILFFGGAIALRRQPAEHKRLMLLTAANFLPPAAARFPVDSLQALGPVWIFGLPIVLTIAALAYDSWSNRKVNKVFLAGSLLLIASFPARMMIGGTETWLRLAEWLTS